MVASHLVESGNARLPEPLRFASASDRRTLGGGGGGGDLFESLSLLGAPLGLGEGSNQLGTQTEHMLLN